LKPDYQFLRLAYQWIELHARRQQFHQQFHLLQQVQQEMHLDGSLAVCFEEFAQINRCFLPGSGFSLNEALDVLSKV